MIEILIAIIIGKTHSENENTSSYELFDKVNALHSITSRLMIVDVDPYTKLNCLSNFS